MPEPSVFVEAEAAPDSVTLADDPLTLPEIVYVSGIGIGVGSEDPFESGNDGTPFPGVKSTSTQ